MALGRAYVAALADHAAAEDAASAYEHVLIELDRLHDDQSPDLAVDAADVDRDLWFELAIVAIANLTRHGVEPLSVELICWMLLDAHAADAGQRG
ncbi:hypothetical protein [Nocardioides sp. YIM 152315]|uniref:hypothetical protein n=1 Tax=Nocardioides sp. YIM 152315 TaxID=3031760 RepID=UPI0023DCA7A7|nr:hypothetical protein [Nocardioides sp. YIM 152315]MDF1605912.1 hypothetical protein [Nocardioides sp. YIM 152315]